MQDVTDNTQILAAKTENNSNAQCTKPRTQQCKYCTKKYKMLGALKKHEECCSQKSTVDSEDDKDSLETIKAQDEKQNTCKDCGQTFKYAKILQKHEAMHKGKYPFWCKLCMINFATHEDKVLHKLHEHPSKGRKHKCKICQNKNFDTEEEYLFHINEVHKGKLDDYYMCSDCGKQFKTKSELTHHNNSKCGTIKQYQCKVCGQYLMTAGSLHNHMLRHTGEQGCMCWYCGKTFLTIGQLKVHERTHTQEKAFVCDVCGKGFCHRQSLITHSTLHTGVKPYQCESCGHSFSCVGNLIKHRRTHADTCGKTPLTSHRVNNPSTKMKVKINTPESSKLKALKKEKELQEKLAAYKEKLNTKHNEPNQMLYENSDSTTPNVVPKQDDSNGNFEVKSESELVPYASAFMQTFEIKDSELKEDYVKHQSDVTVTHHSREPKELNNHRQLNNNVQKHCDNYTNEQESELLNNWGYLSEDSSKIEGAYSIKHFPPDVNTATAFEDTNSTTDCENKKVLDGSHRLHTECDVKNESNDDDDEDHQFNDNYDSEASLQEIPKCNKNEYSRNKKSNQHDKISEMELTRFIIRRGFAGDRNTEGTCQYCKKSYSNMRWLLRHEREHENKMKYSKSKGTHKCSCCKLSFETREACKVHQQDAHADILTCQDCDKLFSNVDSLRSHQNIFHKGLPRKIYVYVCEKCGLQFRQKAFLSHHETNNCGTGPIYDCDICGKGFNSVHTRRSHLRIHDPKKRFLCKFCGKNFRWKGQLKVHERSHTGEKPFKCLYCPKAFGYRESLVTHSSLHTGIKPHLCQACGSRFSCIGNLIKHRATHASTCGVWYSKNQ